MKRSKQSILGTSYHDHKINASPNMLKEILGSPDWEENDGSDKVNFEWVMETDCGSVFTIYDYSEYRVIGDDEKIDFHIGAKFATVSAIASIELKSALKNHSIKQGA